MKNDPNNKHSERPVTIAELKKSIREFNRICTDLDRYEKPHCLKMWLEEIEVPFYYFVLQSNVHVFDLFDLGVVLSKNDSKLKHVEFKKTGEIK